MAASGAKGEKISCDECTEEFPSVSVAIQHKFRKHRQSTVKYYCPHCGMQFPIKVFFQYIFLPKVLINEPIFFVLFCSFVGTSMSLAMGMKEKVALCILAPSVRLHSTMMLLFSTIPNQSTIGQYHADMQYVKLDAKSVLFMPSELWSWSKPLKHLLLVGRSSVTMPRSPRVFITVTYVDLSTSWSTTWKCTLKGSTKKKKGMPYHSKHFKNSNSISVTFTFSTFRELIKCKMCDALFFNKRAYENHNLFHKTDDVYIENEQQRWWSILNQNELFPKTEHFILFWQANDGDASWSGFRYSARSNAGRKVPSQSRDRPSRSQAQDPPGQPAEIVYSSMGMILNDSIHRLSLYLTFTFNALQKSSTGDPLEAGNDSDCLSSASSVSDSDEEEPANKKPTENTSQDQIAC